MKKYSIKEVEELTGIKAHTLRVWEKRYSISPSERTSTNIRFYNDDELKRLINISQLLEKGGKISKIAKLSEKELQDEIIKISEFKCDEHLYVDRLITTMIEMDEIAFHIVLNESVTKFGFIDAMIKVVYPFLTKIGVLWQTGNIHPVQEHFVSHLIRQKLMAETEKLPLQRQTKSTFLLFLPSEELHEIGLLFYNYFLRNMNHKVIYLGSSVPFADVMKVLERQKIDAILTYFVTSRSHSEMEEYLKRIESIFNGEAIYAAGLQCAQIDSAKFKKLKKFNGFEEFKSVSGIKN